MKKLSIIPVLLVLLSLSSCQIISGIFKAGVGVGIFIVVAILAVIIFIVAKVAGGGK